MKTNNKTLANDMTRRFKLYDIVWETDDSIEDETADLPVEVEMVPEENGLDLLDEDQLAEYGFADYLSDKYGYCVNSFLYEEIA